MKADKEAFVVHCKNATSKTFTTGSSFAHNAFHLIRAQKTTKGTPAKSPSALGTSKTDHKHVGSILGRRMEDSVASHDLGPFDCFWDDAVSKPAKRTSKELKMDDRE